MISQSTILITVFLVILLFSVPKKKFLLPFILAACFVPSDQRVIIFDLDFTPLRMLVLVGFLRIILFGEKLSFRWNSFDKLVIAWAICGAFIYLIQWATMKALIYKSGVLFDVIGLYWLFRINISSWKDMQYAIRVFAICSLILAVLVGFEWATGKNPFVALGTVRTEVRKGRYRCQASFSHPIIFGLFWATFVPLFIGFARQNKHKLLFWSAVGASIFIVAGTASSTPVLTLLIVLVLVYLFKWRKYTAAAGWGILALLTTLHIVMTAPVWHLISRIGVVGGSTGWHRYYLINQAVNHFREWMFLGCKSTAHWGWGLSDVTNQYILEGIRGGLITLVLFLLMIYMALRFLLRQSLQKQRHKQQFLTWCLFVAILGHCAAFFGVSYFGQIMIWWYMILAMVGILNESKEQTRPVVRRQTTAKLS